MLPKTPFPKRPAIRRMAAAISKLTHNDSQNQNATSAQAITNLPSVTLAVPAVPAVSRTPESTARARVRNLPPPQNHLPIHKHVLDADRSLVRLLERRAIDHRLRRERCRKPSRPYPDGASPQSGRPSCPACSATNPETCR